MNDLELEVLYITLVSLVLWTLRRLTSKMVLWGFILTWFVVSSPMRSSVSVKATHDDKVWVPWSLVMMSQRSCC